MDGGFVKGHQSWRNVWDSLWDYSGEVMTDSMGNSSAMGVMSEATRDSMGSGVVGVTGFLGEPLTGDPTGGTGSGVSGSMIGDQR